ncbi:MAG: hypothetical protein CVT68_07055 [Actinobacteria bacterium HGW-Actinobacteria-8]|nr:MAG: hypothetical protein CVT68_07055 [Actinobacteria bacterium HGW-Actinobacteria-8]
MRFVRLAGAYTFYNGNIRCLVPNSWGFVPNGEPAQVQFNAAEAFARDCSAAQRLAPQPAPCDV